MGPDQVAADPEVSDFKEFHVKSNDCGQGEEAGSKRG
jgi:hypothetical protein